MTTSSRLLVLLLLALPLAAAPQEAQARPNVLLILADDLGDEALSCYGGESVATPHLDALADSGLRFTRAHSTPLCTPTRIELLTGASNVRSYREFGVLQQGLRTFGHAFGEAGYRTAVAGKWQLFRSRRANRGELRGSLPKDAGFQRWCLWQVRARGERYWQPTLDQDGELTEHGEQAYGPDLFRAFLTEFMAAESDQPFLAYYPMALPHAPFHRPPGADPARGPSERYALMVAHLDRLVGELVTALDERGLRERTLVIFAGDNGSPRQVTLRQHGQDVRGGKGLTSAAGTHVPLILSWPGTIPKAAPPEPGRTCDDLVGLLDLYATLAQACGLPAPQLPDGHSFWARALGREAQPRATLFGYYDPMPNGDRYEATRWALGQRFKLYDDGRLYDVLADPLEQAPLAEPSEVTEETTPQAAARKTLTAVLASMPERPPGD